MNRKIVKYILTSIFSLQWLCIDSWKYYFGGFKDLYFKQYIKRIICRFKGHPNGVIYYNPGGFEPNWCCKDCGEDLG